MNAADTKAEAHVVTLKQFRPLYEKQVTWLTRLPAARAIPIRCEDAFKSRSPSFSQAIAKFLDMTDGLEFTYALIASSPSFSRGSSKHATANFRIGVPHDRLEGAAKDYFDAHFSNVSRDLGYGPFGLEETVANRRLLQNTEVNDDDIAVLWDMVVHKDPALTRVRDQYHRRPKSPMKALARYWRTDR